VTTVHAFPTEKLLKERQRRLLVSTGEKGSQIVKFLPDVIHLGVSIKWSIGSHTVEHTNLSRFLAFESHAQAFFLCLPERRTLTQTLSTTSWIYYCRVRI